MLKLKENKSLLIALIVVIVVVGFAVINYSPQSAKDAYSAVYLRTGEVYVGKLSFFPNMQLKDAFLIENVRDPKDSTKTNLQLTPLKNSVWAPPVIYLNSDQVVFYGPVGEESNVAKALKAAK